MDTAVQKKSRMQYWDVAKGITILLVIMGHLPETNEVIKDMIYSFHMPFFFLANAFFIKHFDVKVHAKKSAKTLLIPYVIVCVLEAICYVFRGNTDVYWSYDIVKLSGEVISGEEMTPFAVFGDKLVDMFMGLSFTSYKFEEFESVWIVWFLVSLFAAKMIYVVLMRGVEKLVKQFVLCTKTWNTETSKYGDVVSLCVCLMLALLGMMIGQRYAFLPWSLDVSLVSLPFFWIGEQLRISGILESRYAKWLYVISFGVWVALFTMGIHSEMAFRIYPGNLLCLVVAAAGSMVVIGLSQWLTEKVDGLSGFFAWCGRYSVIILAIHCLEHRFFDWNMYVFDKIPMKIHWLGIFVIHAAAIVGCAWIVVKCKSGIKKEVGRFFVSQNRR